MFSPKKNPWRLWPVILSIVALGLLQSFWLYNTYQLTYKQFIADIDIAFDEASRKEQTYRIPINEIISPGDVTIQSCGREEVKIIRNCPVADTIVYNNVYGQSLETFINRAFYELRERIVPLNIHCLSDLFAGELHDRNIPLSFTIDHFNITTGKVIETTAMPGEDNTDTLSTHVIVTNISATEGLRAHLHFSKTAVFGQMTGVITLSACLLIVILICFFVQAYFARYKKEINTVTSDASTESCPVHGKSFVIGQYRFDSEKNELLGFGKAAQLNKKENAILEALCLEHGNVVERTTLLDKHWGGSGVIYSRSLDTYITKLRKYLKEDPSVQIVTIKGVGYKLVTA